MGKLAVLDMIGSHFSRINFREFKLFTNFFSKQNRNFNLFCYLKDFSKKCLNLKLSSN